MELMIDIHSHILPGIDDGARTLDESLEMAEIAAADGIEQMVATPHVFKGLSHDPEPAEVIDQVNALQAAVAAKLRILPGSEAHVTHDLAEQAKLHRLPLWCRVTR